MTNWSQRILILYVSALASFISCRKIDIGGIQRDLRCGLSAAEAERIAIAHGYDKCFTPTLAGREDVPERSCLQSSEWIALWLEDNHLTAYQYGDSESSCAGQESGCASEIIPLCHGSAQRDNKAGALIALSGRRTR